jgi:hypothetical protein
VATVIPFPIIEMLDLNIFQDLDIVPAVPQYAEKAVMCGLHEHG